MGSYIEEYVEEYCAKLSTSGKKIFREFVEQSFHFDITTDDLITAIELKFQELLDIYPLPVIRFIDFDTFEKFGSCPRYPDNKEVTTPLSEIDRDNSLLVFISHCWMRGHDKAEGWDGRHHPDNATGDKFKLIVEGIKLLKINYALGVSGCYIWLDFGCVNQDKKKSLKDELERYDKIVECCDAIFTPIVDHKHESWVIPKVFESLFEAYKAKLWNDGPQAYLNRAWCRLEMLYAANIPVLDNSNGVKRHTMFEAGLAFQCSQNRRPHYLYGTKEYNKSGLQVLPPLQNKFLTRYNPTEGHLSVAEDIRHVKFLLNKLQPYIDAKKRVGEYTGPRNSDGQMHGFGVLKFNDGLYYEGEFVNDKLSGRGKFILEQGDTYEGLFKNGLKHGYGVYTYANGDVYEGDSCNNMQHGHGIFKFTNGDVYEGQYFNGERTGKGVYHHIALGYVYSGDFVDGKYCGVGTLRYLDGLQYIGDFVDDQFQGTGTLTDTNGVTYEGGFMNSRPCGQGVMTCSNGDIWEGIFKNGYMDGFGKYYFKAGDTYEGNFVAGRFHGYGVLRFASGELYRGDINDDKRHGRDVNNFVNGIVYEGDFIEGIALKNGTYRFPNGDVFEVNNRYSTINGLFKCMKGKVFAIHYDERNLWTYK